MLRKHVPFLFGFALIGGLYIVSHYNYLLFHSLIEIFSIIVACGIFIISWNSRHTLDNNYLALCWDFIRMNGGTIRVESVVNQGTSVIFRIPAAGN